MQIGHGRQGVLIGEYGFYRPESPDSDSPGTIADGASSDKNRIIGWLEPAAAEASWIVWFTLQGDAIIYRTREAAGAVVGEPIRLKANGEYIPDDDLRTAVHEYFNNPTAETETRLRKIMYGAGMPLGNVPKPLYQKDLCQEEFTESGLYRNCHLDKNHRGEHWHTRVEDIPRATVFYGPFACDKCAEKICRMGREYGNAVYTYPEGPIYPNTEWVLHVCKQRNVERVNGLRSIGFGMVRSAAPEPAPQPIMYSADEVRTILRHAQQRFGPKAQVDTFTVADLDALLKD